MSESPTTRLTLLSRIRDLRDVQAWAEFVELYAPLVYSLARKHGLQDADAADLTQDVLRAVVSAAPTFAYDPSRGSFRGWLFTVAYNQLRKFAHARKRPGGGTGDPAAQQLLEEQPAREDADLWDEQYRRRLFEWAAERVRGSVRPATWQAFWHTAVAGQDPRAVGEALGMSPGAVYIAKSRVLARIREVLEQLPGEDVLPPQGEA
jgi:RNA polymerase sigma-70 factor (ECF subfamily)